MTRTGKTLFIQYVRLKEAVELSREYPYTVPALAHFDRQRRERNSVRRYEQVEKKSLYLLRKH